MGRHTKKLALLAMLTGIAAAISVADLRGSSPRPDPAPPTLNVPITHAQENTSDVAELTPSQPPTPRISVSFNDDTSSTYALLKGEPPTEKYSRRPDIDVWYGEYFKDHNLRVLGASPIEREPSRLGLKISFAF